MRKKIPISIGIGSVSIIMLFVVLALSIFGTLGLMTAYADYKLAVKTRENIVAYYAADQQAEELLGELLGVVKTKPQHVWQETFLSVAKEKGKPLEVVAENHVLTVKYSVAVNELQQLEVTLVGSQDGEEPTLEVTQFQLVNKADWDYDAYQLPFNELMVE